MDLYVFQKGLLKTVRNSHSSVRPNHKYTERYMEWVFVYSVALLHPSSI